MKSGASTLDVRQVGPVLVGQRGQRRRVVGQVDPLARAQRAADPDAADEAVAPHVGGDEGDGPVRDVDRIAGADPVEQRRIRRRGTPPAPSTIVSPAVDLMSSRSSPSRSLGPPRSASTAMSGRWARARRTCAACSRGVACDRLTRSTSTPASSSRSSAPGGVLRRSDRGDDLGPTLQHGSTLRLRSRQELVIVPALVAF